MRCTLSFWLLLFIWTVCPIKAQLPHTFTHYTGEGEFPQRIVSWMYQDHRGVMWFGTWDGLYKFDGYTFKGFKDYSNDSTQLGSSRILKVKEDQFGFIWILNDDSKVYRLETETERFSPIPYHSYSAKDFFCTTKGEVFVITEQNELLRIQIDPLTFAMHADNLFELYNFPPIKQINKVWLDNDGCIWILTDNGVHRYYNDQSPRVTSFFTAHSFYDIQYEDNKYFISSDKGELICLEDNRAITIYLPTGAKLKNIRILSPERLLIGTDKDGLFEYDLTNKSHKHYTAESHPQLKDNEIRRIYIDAHQEAWIQTGVVGVVHFNPRNEQFRYFIQKDKYGNEIRNSRMDMYISEDIYGTLWIHLPGGGFAWYNRESKDLIPFYDTNVQTGWSSANHIAGYYNDKQGNLWISTFKNGLMKATFNENVFQRQSIEQKDPDFEGNNVRALYQDKNGYIWVGSKDRIVRLYDQKMNYIGNLTSQGTFVPYGKEELGMAYAFEQADDGTIWIGTKEKGLIAAIPQSNPLKFRIHTFRHQTDNLYSLSSNDIYSLCIDDNQRLWIATYGQGLNYLDLNEKNYINPRFINARNELKNYPIHQANRIRSLALSPEGILYAGTTNGIVYSTNPSEQPSEIMFSHTMRIPNHAHSLSNNNVHDIFFSRKGDMYACTYGGGLNKLTGIQKGTLLFKSYTIQDGLPSDALLTAQEDEDGNIWLATENELCKYNPASEDISSYPSRYFPQRIIFNEGKSMRTNNNQLAFNTMQGILYFHPDSIQNNTYIPPIILTHFHLTENTKAEDTQLFIDIDKRESITLDHTQNGFNIQFAALDMRHPESIKYAYLLEGFEKSWNEIEHLHNATYTNLPHGNYTLKIKSTNSDGVWVDNIRQLQITVLPSFWETPWAYLLYALCILLIIFIATYILFVIFRLRHKVATEQHISDIKLRFFTNISHELRTPLTLITGPIEQLLQHGNLQETDREQLMMVGRNTNRMLRLVNQILDFRKIQNKKMHLRVQQIDVVPFVRHLMESFQSIADEHSIDFSLESNMESLLIWADADKLEKILFNLLSNAFKYTPQGKRIKVSIHQTDSISVLTIEDQGIGIDLEKQKSLFVRFENFADKSLFNTASTGIGLSLVKELVDMHKGKITVESKKGEGSRFTIQLPLGKEHFEADTEFILSDSIITHIDNTPHSNALLAQLSDTPDNVVDKNKETLLIVEDNTELRYFLHHLFSSHFNILEAENGMVGWEKSLKHIPDIIISDVMMPEMDGIEMLKHVRNERTTSHIPVILLTAKSTIESQIEGMEVGADDYITKPFSGNYLKARIFNLLEQRKKLQALYCATLLPDGEMLTSKDEQVSVDMTIADQQFMNNLMAFIEEHIDNGDLVIEEIAKGMNMSRSVFFKKLKALTGLSPNELLKDIRIKRAAKYIKENDYSIQQIAYMVGFNDAHYFSRCFKQVYGMTPSEYKEK